MLLYADRFDTRQRWVAHGQGAVFRVAEKAGREEKEAVNEHEIFSDSIYEEQTLQAERELSGFISAVTKLYGPEQARHLAED